MKANAAASSVHRENTGAKTGADPTPTAIRAVLWQTGSIIFVALVGFRDSEGVSAKYLTDSGPGTKCCGYGCCPIDSICMSDGGCASTSTTLSAWASSSTSSLCPAPQTVTSTSVVTQSITSTFYTTLSRTRSGTSLGQNSSTSSRGRSHTGEEIIIGSSTFFVESGRHTFTDAAGDTVIVGPSGRIVVGTDTVRLPPGGQGVITTDGLSISYSNPASSSSSVSKTTMTEPDGQTVVSSSSVLIIGGSDTVTIPHVTTPTTLTTDGETFTFEPSSSRISSSTSSSLATVQTVSEPDGRSVVFSGSYLIIGSDTVALPSITAPTTLTTDGEIFTFYPHSSSSPQPPWTTTEPDGVTVISSSGVLIIGSSTVTLPRVTAMTTLTTDGETFTLSPSSSSTKNSTSGGGGGGGLIPCVVPPLPICIPCALGYCYPPGTGPGGGGGGGGGGSGGSSGTASRGGSTITTSTRSGTSSSATSSRSSSGSSTSSTSTSSTASSCPVPSSIDYETEEADDSPCDPEVFVLSCNDPNCAGAIVPPPLASPGVYCTLVNAGCNCTGANSTTPIQCPQNIITGSCEANGCNGTVADGIATCQDAYKGCNCTASATTPGYCTNLNYCPLSNCNGTLDPGSTQWGTCGSGPEKGCICTYTSPGGTPSTTSTSTSTSVTPTPTQGFWVVYETSSPDYSLLLVPDSAAGNCNSELDAAYYMSVYDTDLQPITSNWLGLITSPPGEGFVLTNSLLDPVGLKPTNSTMCGISGLRITFTPGAGGLSFADTQAPPVVGACSSIPDPPVTTCTDVVTIIGGAQTLTPQLQSYYHCEADNNPAYCNGWT